MPNDSSDQNLMQSADSGLNKPVPPKKATKSISENVQSFFAPLVESFSIFGTDSADKKNSETEKKNTANILQIFTNIKNRLSELVLLFKQKNKTQQQTLTKILKQLTLIAQSVSIKNQKKQKKQITISKQSIKSFVESLKTQIFVELVDKVKIIDENLNIFISSSNTEYVAQYAQQLKQYINKISELNLQNPSLLENLKAAASQYAQNENNKFLNTLTKLNEYFQHVNEDKKILTENLSTIKEKIDENISKVSESTEDNKSELQPNVLNVKEATALLQSIKQTNNIQKQQISQFDKNIQQLNNQQNTNDDTSEKQNIDKKIDQLQLTNGKAAAQIFNKQSSNKQQNNKQDSKQDNKNISKIQSKLLSVVKALYTTPEIKKAHNTMTGQLTATENIQDTLKHYFKEWNERDLNKDKFDSDLDDNVPDNIDDDITGEGASKKATNILGIAKSSFNGIKKIFSSGGGNNLFSMLATGGAVVLGSRWINAFTSGNGFWSNLINGTKTVAGDIWRRC